MRAVRLDYVPYSPSHWPGYALLVAAMAGAILSAISYVHTARNLADAEMVVSRLERRVTGHRETTTVTGAPAKDHPVVQRAGELTRKLATPWSRLFKALESYQLDHVALLAVEPDSATGTVRVTAEAKDTAAMLTYIENLRDSGLLAHVALNSHQVVQDNPFKPVRFSFNGQWTELP